VQTSGVPGDKIVASPGRGVGLSVTFDDLSDGIPRIAESALQKAAKQASRKKILQKATKETGYDLGPSLVFVSFC
jgi:hypothetical protein